MLLIFIVNKVMVIDRKCIMQEIPFLPFFQIALHFLIVPVTILPMATSSHDVLACVFMNTCLFTKYFQ